MQFNAAFLTELSLSEICLATSFKQAVGDGKHTLRSKQIIFVNLNHDNVFIHTKFSYN